MLNAILVIMAITGLVVILTLVTEKLISKLLSPNIKEIAETHIGLKNRDTSKYMGLVEGS